MKLKCDQHNRRLLVIEGTGTWVHRTGDQSQCGSKTATIGTQTVDHSNIITLTS